jgi:hypothetical protein
MIRVSHTIIADLGENLTNWMKKILCNIYRQLFRQKSYYGERMLSMRLLVLTTCSAFSQCFRVHAQGALIDFKRMLSMHLIFEEHA